MGTFTKTPGMDGIRLKGLAITRRVPQGPVLPLPMAMKGKKKIVDLLLLVEAGAVGDPDKRALAVQRAAEVVAVGGGEGDINNQIRAKSISVINPNKFIDKIVEVVCRSQTAEFNLRHGCCFLWLFSPSPFAKDPKNLRAVCSLRQTKRVVHFLLR
jgi:hypothetical protein